MQLEAGNYHGRLVQVEVGGVGQKESPAIVLVFDVGMVAANGAWQSLPESVTAEVIWYLTDGAYENTSRKLADVGFNGDFDAPAFAPELYADGHELEMKIEQYESKDRPKWDFPYRGNRKPLDGGALKALSARWRTSHTPTPPRMAPPAPKPAAQPTDPDRAHVMEKIGVVVSERGLIPETVKALILKKFGKSNSAACTVEQLEVLLEAVKTVPVSEDDIPF